MSSLLPYLPAVLTSSVFLLATALWFFFIPRVIIRAVVIQISEELVVRDERLETVKRAIGRALVTNETALDIEDLDEEMGFFDEEISDEG